ncbi:hypothetical protein MHU86_4540 [Fragilaria crotonensis]|nr:hypothetical protein MHU86_4540 [Fragilaria crotonensis]
MSEKSSEAEFDQSPSTPLVADCLGVLNAPPKPEKPRKWEAYLTFVMMVVSFTFGCFLNGFMWIACIDHLDMCYFSGLHMIRCLEEFRKEATCFSEAKIIARFLQPPTDTPVVVISYSIEVPAAVYRVQKIFVNHRSLFALVHKNGSAVVMTHPEYPLSGLPAWEFQEILREQKQLRSKAFKPFIAFAMVASIIHYLLCTLLWARWIPAKYWWCLPLVASSPVYHTLTVLWLRQRQFRRFRDSFLSGTFAGPPESWSLYVEVQRVYGDSDLLRKKSLLKGET